MNALKRTLGIFLFLLVAPFSIACAQVSDTLAAYSRSRTLESVLDLFDRYSYPPVDIQDCYLKLLKQGITACDEYAALYITDEDKEVLDRNIAGHYSGVGMEVLLKDKRFYLFPFQGSPADSAGVKTGDVLVRVDSVYITDQFSIADVVRLIRGQIGTTVGLTMFRDGLIVGPFTARRAQIDIPSVAFTTIGQDIGYIRIHQFYEFVSRDFTNALHTLANQSSVKGVIIDVRGNPGGYMDQALDILGAHFAPDSAAVLVQIKSRPVSGDSIRAIEAKGQGAYVGFPTVVLVNRFSASASEIFAGVLQAWGSATVVGDTTFGKGSIQSLLQTLYQRDGTAFDLFVKLTTGQYCIGASCRPIDRVGVIPDYVVSDMLVKGDTAFVPRGQARASAQNDPQFQKAVEVLRQKTKP